ncbi:6592_t:CDS:2 [Cetraspora pellucida]|uniref:6592_t:CDS:1 n=1 Tax=Cetraspora pellucida TaxID=1433469 RepID=A0A9N9JIN3_9GLOM|nr:6592_t:CDS:2 [Cetraspora pellucida]
MGQSLKKPVKNGINGVAETSKKSNEETYLKSLSVLEAHRFIQGRKFCLAQNASLALPRDNEEAMRINKVTKLIKVLFGSNYSAPVTEFLTCGGAKILEIGTGGGLWLSEMSIEYPMSIFLGLDITTIFNPMYRVLQPGGWMEIHGTPSEIIGAGPATRRFMLAVRQCLQINGHNPDIVRTIPEKLRSLNVKNIQVVEKPLLLSRNGAPDEQIDDELLLRTVEAFRVIMKVAIGCTDEEYDELKRNVGLEAETTKMHIMVIRTFGQKDAE